VRDIASDHLSSVRHKLDELRGLEAQLGAFIDSCESVCCGGQSRDCTVLTDLAKA